MLARLRAFFKALLRRRRMESEMDAELQFHMEARAADLARSGISHGEAERRARIEFGGVALAKEECRQSLGLRVIDELRQDLRYAARSLRRSPAFTAAAVVSLALGIGANTVIFSFVDAVLLKPFGYQEPDRLVRLFHTTRTGMQQMSCSLADLMDFRDRNAALSDVAAQAMMGGGDTNFSGTGLDHAEHVYYTRVTTNYFRILGIHPVLGRDFLPDESQPGQQDVALVSNIFWREHLGGDPGITGKIALLNGRSCRIAGILPPGAMDRQFSQVWIPMSFAPKDMARDQWMAVIGKLRPGVSLAQANAAIKALEITAQLYQSTWEYRSTRILLLIAFGAVSFVLMIACANVANLMLARAAARRQEVAIRLSIGAGRFRLVRQFLTESLVLAAAGGALGALLAYGAMPLAKRIVPVGRGVFPAEANPAVDWRVLLFALCAALAAGVLFGLAPAFQFSASPAPRLATRARRNRLQGTLLTAETALALVLAAGAGLMTHSFARLMAVDPGYRPERVLTWSVHLSPDRYPANTRRAYQQEFLERLRRIPSVEAAAASNSTPIAAFDGSVDCAPRRSDAMYWTVTPEYLPVLRIPLATGRWLLPSDTAGSPLVVVIDRKVARECFGSANPVGRNIRMPSSQNNSPPLEVVGVAGSVKALGLGSSIAWGGIYLPLAQAPDRELTSEPVFLARTREEPSTLAPTIRAIAATLDKNQAVIDVKSMEDIIAEDVRLPRFRAVLFGSFGVLALLLAWAGVYGVAHYAVAQRTHEIGVRMALGARGRQIVALVLRQSTVPIAAGLAIGMGAALMLTRVLERMLFEIKPRDPTTLIGVAAVVAGAALLAALLPARRASRLDPLATLRHE